MTTPTFTPTLLTHIKHLSSNLESIPASQLSELSPSPDLHALLTYFSTPASSAISPPPQVCLDMSKPLSWYFISTSHNTYLSGNQVFGAASGEAYSHVLVRGCRCVEIDVWDGEEKRASREHDVDGTHESLRSRISEHLHHRSRSRGRSEHEHEHEHEPETDAAEKGRAFLAPGRKASVAAAASARREPRVLHGHTLTKEVSFRDVCVAIRHAAFKTSDLPVIVSLEVHAGAEQQAIMVEIMEECWKGMLIHMDAQEECKVLPSPDSLRGKILVKVKAAPLQALEAEVTGDLASEAARLKLEDSDASGSGSEEDKKLQHKTTNSSVSSGADGKKKKKRSIIASLSALGKYTQAFHFKDLHAPEAVIPTHVFSLSEKKLMIVHATPGPTIFSHNKNFLMRAFPSGTRVDSSNLDPAVLWRKGVQMVALNWQSCDAATMMNQAQFDGTGGWLLKPKGYHGSILGENKIGSESQIDAMPRRRIQLSVELLAAQYLPMKKTQEKGGRLAPYVKCELHIEKPEEAHGLPMQKDGRSSGSEYKRKSKTSKTADPDFLGEEIRFPEVDAVEELSFIRFKVMNDTFGKDALLGWSCIRLDRLREGYRLLHLLNAESEKSDAVMLVKINKQIK